MALMKLSDFHKAGKFSGYRKMIGGEVFYFGEAFGVTDRSVTHQLRALTAAQIVADHFAAVGAWTDASKATAKAAALAAVAPATPVAATIATPSITTPSEMLYATMDRFVAEQKRRVEAKDITWEFYAAISGRINAAKQGIEDMSLNSVGRDVVLAAVDYWKKRPMSSHGKPYGVQTVENNIGMLKMFFRWAYNAELWNGFRAWEKSFDVAADNLRTPREKKQIKDGKTYFTVDELATIYAHATPRTRLYILLALNCAMGQMEIATLREWELHLDDTPAYIDRDRNKTGVPAKYELWNETAELVGTFSSHNTSLRALKRILPEYREGIDFKRPKAVPNQITGDIEDITSLALRTEDG